MRKESLYQRFTNLMIQGKLKQAVRLLEQDASNGVLPLDADTLKELRTKHPGGQPVREEMILKGPINHVNRVITDLRLNHESRHKNKRICRPFTLRCR